MCVRSVAIFLGFAYASAAAAQAVTTIETQVQATVVAPGGKIKGCGLRVVGITTAPVNAAGDFESVDASLSLYEKFGLVKAGLLRSPLKPNPQLRVLDATVEWVRFASDEALTPLGGKVLESDSPGFLMFAVSADAGAKALARIMTSGDIWISFKDKNNALKLYSGKIQMTADVERQFSSCIDAFAAEVQRR